MCSGDSGGPLICPIDGKATLVGVTSKLVKLQKTYIKKYYGRILYAITLLCLQPIQAKMSKSGRDYFLFFFRRVRAF